MDQYDPLMPEVPVAPANGHHPANGTAVAAATDDDLQILPRSSVMTRHKFRLEYTGSDALVRKIPLARLVTLGNLSPSMQPIVMAVFEPMTGGDDTLSTSTTLDLLRRNDAVVDGAVMLGFIKPRIVATQEEAEAANDPFVWSLDEVDPRDRQAYFDLVTADEQEAAKALTPFPTERLQDSQPDESSATPQPAKRPARATKRSRSQRAGKAVV